MKQFLGAGMLLTLFAVIALSFCVFSFSVNENTEAPLISAHYAEDARGLGRVHISFAERVTSTAAQLFGTIKEAAGALPFFAVDLAERIYGAAEEAAALFADLLDTEREDGAVLV